MDPFSLLASVAGVATAGATVTGALYTLISTVRNAPKEMRQIAAEMSNLTSVLEHLRSILTEGKELKLTRPLFLRDVRHVIRNIRRTQEEIIDMINKRTILRRLKFVVNAKRLSSDMEKHKVTLTLQVNVLHLAISIR